jgi:cytochrome c553
MISSKAFPTFRRVLRMPCMALATLALLAFAITQNAHAAPPAHLPDTIAQRVQACIACHGREGSATNAGYFPRLAGKPAGYLFNQLVSFRDGRRFNSDMAHMVEFLSDDYLLEIAQYFAALEFPYPPPVVTDASAEQLRRGRQLAAEGDSARNIPACVSCHGAALTGVQPGIPGLLGLPRVYLASQLGAWLTNDRHALAPDCMTKVGRSLTTQDVNDVASWLATQPVPADAHAVTVVPGTLALTCSAMQRGAPGVRAP